MQVKAPSLELDDDGWGLGKILCLCAFVLPAPRMLEVMILSPEYRL